MEDLKWSSVFFIIISNNFMEEKCVCSVQIWKEVFDYFDREPKKIEINENYSIDEDAKETLQEKIKPIEFENDRADVDTEIRQYTNPYVAGALHEQIEKTSK